MVILEVVSVLVLVLDTIPLFLPLVLSESRVVGEAVDEEITVRDSIVDRETGGVSDGIGVWRELGAFEEESTGLREVNESLLAESDHTGFNLDGIDLFS